MSLKRIATLVVALLSTVSTGCAEKAEPVATLAVAPGGLELSYPAFATLELSWTMEADLGEVTGKPIVFVHMLDGAGSVVRTFDHELPFSWQSGRSESYDVRVYQSAMAPPVQPGTYTLAAGLYDAAGRRWALSTGGEELGRHEYAVGSVTVPEQSDEVPMLYFSPSWLTAEGGTDSQILARRWLTEAGAIRVAEVPGPGTLYMMVRIPEPEPDFEELVLDEGAEQIGVAISSPCGELEVNLTGTGVHHLDVPIEAGAEGAMPEECEISLTPNFYLLRPDSLGRRVLALEILSWTGG